MLTIGNKKLNQKGMTLIELVIAMMILSIVTLGLISMMTRTIIVMYDFGDTTEQVLNSQETIEVISGQVVTTPNASETFNFNGIVVDVNGEEVSDGEIEIFIPQ